VVAGFSQGGAVALLMLRQNVRLAGVVGLSTYLTLRSRPPLVSTANASTPVFCAHGTADQVVRRLTATFSSRCLLQSRTSQMLRATWAPTGQLEHWEGQLQNIEGGWCECEGRDRPRDGS